MDGEKEEEIKEEDKGNQKRNHKADRNEFHDKNLKYHSLLQSNISVFRSQTEKVSLTPLLLERK